MTEWTLTPESENLLDDLGADPRTSRLTTLYGHDSMRERLEQVERAAVARALTVDNVARALGRHADTVVGGYVQHCYGPDCTRAIIAALTEDVP